MFSNAVHYRRFAHRFFFRHLSVSTRSFSGGQAKAGSASLSLRSTNSEILGVVLFGGLSVGCFGLGIWQVQRRQQKIQMIEARQQTLSNDSPLPFPQWMTDSDLEKMVYQPVQVEGDFLYDEQMLLGLRGGPSSVSGQGSNAGSGGISTGGLGYYIITPVKLPNGRIVLVNRGWSPKDRVHDALATREDPSKPMFAVIRPGENESRFVPSSGANPDRVWIRLDIQRMSESCPSSSSSPSSPASIMLDSISSSDQLARRQVDDFLVFPTSPLIHASYAFTWLALSAAGIAMTIRFRRRWR